MMLTLLNLRHYFDRRTITYLPALWMKYRIVGWNWYSFGMDWYESSQCLRKALGESVARASLSRARNALRKPSKAQSFCVLAVCIPILCGAVAREYWMSGTQQIGNVSYVFTQFSAIGKSLDECDVLTIRGRRS